MTIARKLLSLFGLQETASYWLKIDTKVPKCTYYFGPFDSPWEARLSQAGYIEDLVDERAQGIYVELKRCQQPPELTICDLEDDF